MFSNEEVRAAMDDLVKQKGENHTSFGKYADPLTGQGACFLGALCEHMGLAIPVESTNAKNVMGEKAVSKEMQGAFAIAQMLNDMHFEWKYVLMGVDLALAVDAPMNGGGCPCGCMASVAYNEVINKVKAKRALDKAGMPKVPLSYYAQGGIVTSTITGTNGIGKITININGMTESAYSLVSGMQAFSKAFAEPGLVVAKKDHALVA